MEIGVSAEESVPANQQDTKTTVTLRTKVNFHVKGSAQGHGDSKTSNRWKLSLENDRNNIC